MAALTPAQIELANSLTQEELPHKLRCAICSKLAVNTFRLPCCETAICETCQSTLPSSCPVCEHSPVSGADCTVYKSLRTTVRVFLKTEEKKRESARPKTNGSAPPTPVEATTTPSLPQPASEPLPAADNAPGPKDEAKPNAGEVGPDQPLPTTEPNDGPALAPEEANAAQIDAEKPDSAADPATTTENNHNDSQAMIPNGHDDAETADPDNEADADQDASGQAGMGSVQNNFSGMNLAGGDMNQMQMMMAMQNGMNPAAFGSFPMMGMGMGMDPMMQNMYMNGGFGSQGMGMNGMNMNMNMNMGMNGFSGGNNVYGQQSWNVGQDNYNPNPAGMGNGDFGNFNSGFRTGYNGNYGPNNQYIDYGRGGYGFRGRGRGRGFNFRGFGRGYNQQGYNGRPYGQQQWAEQNFQAGSFDAQAEASGPDALQSTGEGQKVANTDEFGRTVRLDADGQEEEIGHKSEGGQGQDDAGADTQMLQGSARQIPSDDAARAGEAHDDAAMYNGDIASGQYPITGLSTSRAGSMAPPVAAAAVPLNAPTGPKAMRQGLPNTSLLHLRARGFISEERGLNPGSNGSVVEGAAEGRSASRSSSRRSPRDADGQLGDRGQDRDHKEKEEPRGDRGRPRSHSRTHSQSRSSRSRERKEARRHRRHRSKSATEDEREDEYRRRKHRSKRSGREDEYNNRSSKDEKYGDDVIRPRSASPDRERDREHKRSSRRSHRERERGEKDKGRESDRDRHRKSGGGGGGGGGGHRKDRERDRDRKRERERERDRDRDRAREREYRHHRSSRRNSAEPPTPVESDKDFFNPPTGPRGSAKEGKNSHRRDASSSSRRGSQASQKAASGKDPHTLEREARDRERLLKEAQRMAGLAGLASLKRGRDAGDDRGGGRRKSRRSEVVYGDEEERMRRSEAEREGGRWD